MMDYSYSKRDKANRATLTIKGNKVGRVHFRESDAWLNPYKGCRLKSKEALEKLGMKVVIDPTNNSFPIKVFVNTSDEQQVAAILEKAIRDLV